MREDALRRWSTFLGTRAIPEAFLTTFTKHEDRLFDAKEDFDKVVEFFESNQRTAFDHAKDFLSRTEGIEYASDDIPNAVENVAKVREILKDPKALRPH